MPIAAYISQGEKDEAEIEHWLESRAISRYQVEWFGDKKSNMTLGRPGFDRLQHAIIHGQVTCLVLWKLERVSGRLREGMNILVDWANRGLKLVVVSPEFVIDGSQGRTISALLQGLAEIEQDFRKERQQAGIANARKNGVYKGRKKGTTRGNPVRARELKERGLSLGAIADDLGVSKRTVIRYFKEQQALGSAPRPLDQAPGADASLIDSALTEPAN